LQPRCQRFNGAREPTISVKPTTREGAIRKSTVNLLGAAALFAAGVALLRRGHPRPESTEARNEETQAREKAPETLRLDRLRELGI